MNPANVVTWARIALIPFFVYFLYEAADSPTMTSAAWTAVAIYVVATLSDYLDGYLARRLDVITPTGQFLDPLADKFLVGAAIFGLMAFKDFPVWAALLIAIREVVIVALRSAAMRRGNSMPASRHAKYKTTVQLLMVFVWLFPRAGAWVPVQDALLWAAVVITAYSGGRYLLLANKLLVRQPGTAGRSSKV